MFAEHQVRGLQQNRRARQSPEQHGEHAEGVKLNIRTKYGADLAKVRKTENKSGNRVDDVHTPTVPWFDAADAFLRRVSQPRSSISNLEISIRSYNNLYLLFIESLRRAKNIGCKRK